MDLKCFHCVRDQWANLKGSGSRPDTAAAQAPDAVTTHDGTALCAEHTVRTRLTTYPFT